MVKGLGQQLMKKTLIVNDSILHSKIVLDNFSGFSPAIRIAIPAAMSITGKKISKRISINNLDIEEALKENLQFIRSNIKSDVFSQYNYHDAIEWIRRKEIHDSIINHIYLLISQLSPNDARKNDITLGNNLKYGNSIFPRGISVTLNKFNIITIKNCAKDQLIGERATYSTKNDYNEIWKATASVAANLFYCGKVDSNQQRAYILNLYLSLKQEILILLRSQSTTNSLLTINKEFHSKYDLIYLNYLIIKETKKLQLTHFI